MIKLFESCPACGGQIVITECKCSNCNLEMRGEFGLGPFNRLSEDQLTFVQVFLRTRGNLSEVEKILGVSYPTIRNKLDEVNRKLQNVEPASEAPAEESTPDVPSLTAEERQALLKQVAEGKLTAAEALDKLGQTARK